ncbi:Chitinase class I [Musa troglodytarum]|uniref:chitinase n=2 Tax=Musa troglodytarum TaxID=320322 RepID=A0A9E7HZ32_9LILI|nr:Chitinase class I [Musa troglodytarum]
MGKMRAWWTVLAVIVAAGAAVEASKSKTKACDKRWECSGSVYCCNETVYQFENLFSKRNAPVAHAVGFWDYQSFVTAAALYEPLGFGTTGDKQTKMKEVAAFLGHVGSNTSCGYGVVTGGPLAWGLSYNHEMSPSQDYCDPNYLYPCVKGVDYYGRGTRPVDLLNHPEFLEQNATLAFQATIWRVDDTMRKQHPSAHDVLSDTGSLQRMMLYRKGYLALGYIDSMNNIISHYQHYLDLMGVGRQFSGDNLDCAEQVPFNPSYKAATS